MTALGDFVSFVSAYSRRIRGKRKRRRVLSVLAEGAAYTPEASSFLHVSRKTPAFGTVVAPSAGHVRAPAFGTDKTDETVEGALPQGISLGVHHAKSGAPTC